MSLYCQRKLIESFTKQLSTCSYRRAAFSTERRRYTTYTTEYIRSVFSSVAGKYDLMNDLMSLGMHRIWKDIFVKEAVAPLETINEEIARVHFKGEPYKGKNVVHIMDLAGGTGDITFRILDKAQKMGITDSSGFTIHNEGLRATPEITVVDPSVEMTEIGRKHAVNLGYADTIKWKNAPAENIPVGDKSFDIITIAFGVRNFSDREAALKECYRTLKPGGRLLILEFSHCESDFLKALYESYSNIVIPKLGEYVAKDKEAYEYLVDSIRHFPTQDQLADILHNLGYSMISYRNLTGGIVAIHSAFKPE